MTTLDDGKAAFLKGFLDALSEDWDKSEGSNNAKFAAAVFSGLVAYAKATDPAQSTAQDDVSASEPYAP